MLDPTAGTRPPRVHHPRTRCYRNYRGAVDLAELLGRPAWHRDALCAEYAEHADWWFPRRGDLDALDQARAVCARCLVRAECAAYAIDHAIDHGIWGGLSAMQRRRARRPDPPPQRRPEPYSRFLAATTRRRG